MCKHPIRIINKGYQPNDPTSPYYVDVPCGHCDECKQSRISEVLFRADWESVSCKQSGGFMAFATLTFNNSHLNIVEYKLPDGIHRVSSWNNRLVRKYLNSLQHSVARNGGCLKYLLTCERGGSGQYTDSNGKVRIATSRPHYHIIYWVHCVDESIFRAYSKRDFLERATTLWSSCPTNNTCIYRKDDMTVAEKDPIGHVYIEDVNRDESCAVKYVVKYCVKDSFESMFSVDQSTIVSSTFPISYCDMCPRVRYSNGIGISFLDHLGYADSSDKDLAIRLDNYVSSTSDGGHGRVPRYYIKKLSQRVVPLCVTDTEISSSPLVFVDGKLVPKYDSDVKSTLNTCTLHTPIHRILFDLQLDRSADEFIHSYSLLDSIVDKLPCFLNAPFFNEFSHRSRLRFTSICESAKYLLPEIHFYLDQLVTVPNYIRSLLSVRYHRSYASSLYYERLSHSVSPDEDDELLTFHVEHLFGICLDIFSMYRQYIKSSTIYDNNITYIRHRNKAISKTPELFVQRVE